MKKMIVTAVTLTMMVVMIESAKAQSSADKGLATIDSNVENSAANLASYKKNLAVVEENIAEIGKARQQVKGQGDEVKKHLQDNKKSLDTLAARDKEVQTLIGKEQTANQDDQKRIQELEQLLAQIKGNIEKRNQNIAAYQEEQRKSEDIKRPFIERQQAIQSQLNEVQTRDKELTAENQVWTNKRKGYQGEIKKWEKELERQKGLQENYRSLAEAK